MTNQLLMQFDAKPTSAKQLSLCRVSPAEFRQLNETWHSRLPLCAAAGRYRFGLQFGSDLYGVAMWSNPTARLLPQEWLELRRLAISPDAPKFSATRMLGLMERWIRKNTDVRKLISYQDMEVHQGTIYKAANWHEAEGYQPRARYWGKWDRTRRDQAVAKRMRWERDL